MALLSISPDGTKYPGHELYIRLHYPVELRGVGRDRLKTLLTCIQKCKNSNIQDYACTLGAVITPDTAPGDKASASNTDSGNFENYFCQQAPPNVKGGGLGVPTILVEIHFSVEDYHETLGDQVAAAIKEQVWNVLVRDNTDRGTCDDFKIRCLKYTEAKTDRCTCCKQCPTQSLPLGRLLRRKETDV